MQGEGENSAATSSKHRELIASIVLSGLAMFGVLRTTQCFQELQAILQIPGRKRKGVDLCVKEGECMNV